MLVHSRYALFAHLPANYDYASDHVVRRFATTSASLVKIPTDVTTNTVLR
jgi:hypothetical protein